MKLSLVATALLALTSTIGMAQTIPQRQFNQQGRIAQGVRSGQLTGRETRGLERREFSIHRQERAMRRANYGRLNHRDRAILNLPAQSHLASHLPQQAQRLPPRIARVFEHSGAPHLPAVGRCGIGAKRVCRTAGAQPKTTNG